MHNLHRALQEFEGSADELESESYEFDGMGTSRSAHVVLEQEARALLRRVARVKPFALHETMVPAALPSTAAQAAIEEYLAEGRRELRVRIAEYLAWLRGPGREATPQQAQRRFVFLRLRFNVVLSHFDVFADVLTQRSEHETGPWLAGLDVVAADALALKGDYFDTPALICYLDRGHGAAIAARAHGCRAGARAPLRWCAFPANAWSERVSRLLWCTRSATRARRRST
jgi:hypothetical protein